MIRGLGYLIGIILIVVAVGDAWNRMTVDGWFLILAGTGLGVVGVAYVTDQEGKTS